MPGPGTLMSGLCLPFLRRWPTWDPSKWAKVIHSGSIVNVDSTIVAQAPKLAPHIPAMVARIAGLLGLPAERVNVKAKTAEKLGPVGEGRAIEARAVALLARG